MNNQPKNPSRSPSGNWFILGGILLATLLVVSGIWIWNQANNNEHPTNREDEPHTDQQAYNELAFWEARFTEASSDVAKDDPVGRVAIVDGSVLLDRVAMPLEFAKQWADPALGPDSILMNMAGAHARVGRMEKALACCDAITKSTFKQGGLFLVANMRINQKDPAGALKVGEQLTERKDMLFASVARFYMAERDFEKAQEIIQQISDEKQRTEQQSALVDAKSMPQIGETDYVERMTNWGVELIRKKQENFAGARALLEMEAPKPETMGKIIRHLAEAKSAHHDKKTQTCLAALDAAYAVALTLADEDLRITEQLSIACLAVELEQLDWARKHLEPLLKDPKSDDYHLAVITTGLRVADAITAVFDDPFLQPYISRWSESEFPSELLAVADSLAKRNEFDRLAHLLSHIKSAPQRVMICNLAIEYLTRKQ